MRGVKELKVRTQRPFLETETPVTTLRWKENKIPFTGYERMLSRGRWVSISDSEVKAIVNSGEVVLWNPEGGFR